MNDVFEPLVIEILEKYKTTPERVKALIETELSKNIKLLEALKENKNIERLAIYKDFEKKLKKKIYFELRQYYSGDNPLEHKSIAERTSTNQKFNEFLIKLVSNGETVLDLGGGMMLPTLSKDFIKKISKYTWVDKDKKAHEFLIKYGNELKLENPQFNLELINENLDNYLDQEIKEKFDLILMVKLIPLLTRQHKYLLTKLAQLNGNKIFITGNKQALAKKRDIRKREEKVIKEFIDLTRKKIVESFESETEFGYVIS